MPMVDLQDGLSFPTDADETILAAAERAGLNIGYACRTGRCSTCKCRVLSGSTVALRPELGLEPSDARDGWVLSCVRTATSDAVLYADELIPFPLPKRQILPCRIDKLTMLAPDVAELRLRLPTTVSFVYLPGQYIDIIGPGGVRRSYSLASGGGLHMLVLHIRNVPGGELSNYWFNQAKPGDLLRLSGPLGTFFLRDVAGKSVVFLATGTGIAPVTAMLEALRVSDAPAPSDITVLWGARQTIDFYIDLGQSSENYSYQPVLSRPDPVWSGRLGYVQDRLIADYDLSRTVFYACGSDAMIRSARTMLVSAGLNPHDFLSDAFVCSAAT